MKLTDEEKKYPLQKEDVLSLLDKRYLSLIIRLCKCISDLEKRIKTLEAREAGKQNWLC